MTTTPPPNPAERHDGTYEVRLRGHLDPRWCERLDVPVLTHEDGGTTLLRGVAADQAVLHGLLQRIRDLGLPLVAVIHVPPATPAGNPIQPRGD